MQEGGREMSTPRGIPLVTQMPVLQASRSNRVNLNGILECVNSYLETRTVQQPQPDAANPNTAESMVKTSNAEQPREPQRHSRV
jgi:hypothetical protein